MTIDTHPEAIHAYEQGRCMALTGRAEWVNRIIPGVAAAYDRGYQEGMAWKTRPSDT